MKTGTPPALAGARRMTAEAPTRPAPRELTEELLELVVGGAGTPAPELLLRLLREGVLPPPPTPRP